MLFLIVIIMMLLLWLQRHWHTSRGGIASGGITSFRSTTDLHAVERLVRVILLLVLLITRETEAQLAFRLAPQAEQKE
jgi:hypothetical protein